VRRSFAVAFVVVLSACSSIIGVSGDVVEIPDEGGADAEAGPDSISYEAAADAADEPDAGDEPDA
jgi:hypothetical protein